MLTIGEQFTFCFEGVVVSVDLYQLPIRKDDFTWFLCQHSSVECCLPFLGMCYGLCISIQSLLGNICLCETRRVVKNNLKGCNGMGLFFRTLLFTTFCIVKEIPPISGDFMVKYLAKNFEKNSNLKHHKFLKEFTTLNPTTFEQGEFPPINIYIYGKYSNSKLQLFQYVAQVTNFQEALVKKALSVIVQFLQFLLCSD